MVGKSAYIPQPVGTVGAYIGDLRRQPIGNPMFSRIEAGDVIHAEDTLVTSESGRARLMLHDGTMIELQNSSMVILSFAGAPELGAISRAPAIQVVSGMVKAKAGAQTRAVWTNKTGTLAFNAVKPGANGMIEVTGAAPVPQIQLASEPVMPRWRRDSNQEVFEALAEATPEPMLAPVQVQRERAAAIIAPKDGEVLKVASWAKLEYPVILSWTVTPLPEEKELALELRLFRKGELRPITQRNVVSTQLEGKHSVTLDRPGAYTWELLDVSGEKPKQLASSTFEVSNEIRGWPAPELELEAKGRKIQAKLAWKAVKGAKYYQVRWSLRGGAQRTDRVDDEEYVLKNAELSRGDVIVYQVSAESEKGFKVIGAEGSIEIDFPPPVLTSPKDGASMRLVEVGSDVTQDGVLLTWRRDVLADSYLVQISKDASFTKIEKELKTALNLIAVRELAAGEYHWRVRSVTAKSTSRVSKIFRFTLQP